GWAPVRPRREHGASVQTRPMRRELLLNLPELIGDSVMRHRLLERPTACDGHEGNIRHKTRVSCNDLAVCEGSRSLGRARLCIIWCRSDRHEDTTRQYERSAKPHPP